MSRPKKQPESEEIQEIITEGAVENQIIDSTDYQTESSTPPVDWIGKYKRSKHGLIDSVEYHFSEDGSVDWRKMVKNEFLYPNKGWFDSRKKEMPSSVEGLADNQLLIMLGGIKEIAKLRGFTSVNYDIQHVSEKYVVAKCAINWICNYETENQYGIGVTYEDVANATLDNTDDFCAKFLETIACNRAFVRCVRNFLNIHIVGADEIDKSKGSSASNSGSVESSGYENNTVPVTPTGILEKTLREKHGVTDFDGAKGLLRALWSSGQYRFEGVKDWKDFADIPAKEARILLPIFSKK